MKIEIKAKEFATKKHEGQFRKDETTPYIKHPEAVVNILRDIEIVDEEILAAAWLHDTLEDTDTTIEELSSLFGNRVAFFVYLLTKNESNKCYYPYSIAKLVPKEVQLIKLADVLHNISTLNEIKDPAKKEKAVFNKINDCKHYYFDLASKICPEVYEKIREGIIQIEG